MRRRLVGMVRCCELAIHYYLLADDGQEGRRQYGILVEGGGDSVSIPRITVSRLRVQSLLERLIRGRVTPVTALDVVEDWLLA